MSAATISAATAGLIASIIGGGAALTGAGVSAYDANNASIDQGAAQKANAAALLQQQQSAANQANLTKQEAVLGAQGQAQEQTGGSLTDPGTSSITDLLAGYPGFQGGSSGTSTGTGVGPSGISGGAPTPPAAGGSSGAPPDIGAILAALRSGGTGGGAGGLGSGSSISGGNWQTQSTAPQSTFELSNPVLG